MRNYKLLFLLLLSACAAAPEPSDTGPQSDSELDTINPLGLEPGSLLFEGEVLGYFADSPTLQHDIAIFVNDNALAGELSVDKTSTGDWIMSVVKAEVASEDEGHGDDAALDQGTDDYATSYWYDYTSDSKSGSCSGSLTVLDAVTFSSSTAGLYYTGGDNRVQAAARWSGCLSSGGSLIVAQTVTGTSITSASATIPASLSVTVASSTRLQWSYTITPSSRSASADVCVAGVDGFVTGRTTSATLQYYATSSSLKVLATSKTSWYWRDAWASAPVC